MQKIVRTTILAAGLAFALGSPTAQAGLFGKSAPDPITLDITQPATQLAGAFEGAKPGMLAGSNRVVIGNMRIVVITEAVGRGTSAPGFANPNSSTSSITAHYSLRNLQPAMLQSMADRARSSLESSLQAAGFQVLPASSLQGHAGSAALSDKAALQSVQLISTNSGDNLALMVTPAGLPVKLPMGATAKDAEGHDVAGMLKSGASVATVAGSTGILGKAGGSLGRFGGMASRAMGAAKMVQTMGSGISAVGDASTKVALAREMGANILDVTYTLTFADIKGSKGSRFVGNDTASVNASFQPAIVQETSAVTVTTPATMVRLDLKRPLVIQGPALSGVRNTTTNGDIAGNVTGAVLSGLIALQYGGGMHTSQTLRREVDATEQYGDVVAANLAVVNQAVVTLLKQ